jgi:membrane associated rhomboid family serine protease
MWVILPIGHDQGIRHFPWVTAGIAALCLLVQLHRTVAAPSDEEMMAAISERASLEQQLLMPHLSDKLKQAQRRPGAGLSQLREVEKWKQEHAALVASLKAGTLTAPDDPTYRAWLDARAAEERLTKRDLGYRMAYRPSDKYSLGLLLSAFAHGGWMHLLGNMLFLYMVGCNLEDRWGRGVFAGLYLAGALFSAISFYVWHPGEETALVGASGAVSAAMGAFLVCFHRAEIRFLIWAPFRGAHTTEVYAFWVFPLWFGQQALNSWLESYVSLGVAYSAHVGGFVLGVTTALVLKASGIEQKHLLPTTAAGTEWKEDPDFLRAVDLINRRDLVAAVPLLQAVLARRARHEGALEQLARAAVKLGDPALATQAVSAYLDELARAKLPQVLPLATELRLLEQPWPLTERAGAVLVRAAGQADKLDVMILAAARLLQQHPGSAFAPGVLWEVARAQERHKHAELARTTLQQLISRYPDDPFAAQARRKLEG